MNILYITHYDKLYGGNKSLIDQCADLVKRNIGVFVIAPNDNTEFSENIKKIGAEFFAVGPISQYATTKIRKSTLKNRIKDFVKYFLCTRKVNKLSKKIAQIIKENRIDIVHTNSSVILEGAVAAKKAKVPHVLHVRECISEAYNLRYSCPRYTKKYLYDQSKSIITISNAVKNYISPLVDEKSKIKVIYDRVELGKVDDTIPTTNIDKKIFVTIGVMNSQKGFHDAIEAFGKMNKKAQEEAELWIVGGYNEENPYYQDLIARIKKYNIEDRVKFLGFRNDIGNIVENAYCGLTCSYMEGLGRTTIEYMLCGKPVIASDSGATPEIVHDGQNGVIYEYGNTDELSQKMEYIINNPNVAKDLGQAGKKYAENEFSEKNYSSSLLEVYCEIVNN